MVLTAFLLFIKGNITRQYGSGGREIADLVAKKWAYGVMIAKWWLWPLKSWGMRRTFMISLSVRILNGQIS